MAAVGCEIMRTKTPVKEPREGPEGGADTEPDELDVSGEPDASACVLPSAGKEAGGERQGGSALTSRRWNWAAIDALVRQRFLRIAIGDYRFTGEEAEDILQSVYERILSRDTRVADPVAYLRTAFLNACINASVARGAARKRVVSKGVLPEPREIERQDEKLISRLYAVQAVSAALRVAGEKCKRIIQLYYGRELTLNQMVEETGYSRKTIWKRIWDCLQRMREGAP